MTTQVPIVGAIARAELTVRCIEVARECLEGDPFRAVPQLEMQAVMLFAEYNGGDACEELMRLKVQKPELAYAVASQMLQTARTLAHSR
jgi:hypothetical protein